MDELRSRLAEWRAEGLITVDQEQAIAATESLPQPGQSSRRLLEMLTYLGAVLFTVGALIISFDLVVPDDFFDASGNSWAALIVALGATLGLGGIGWAISERADDAVSRRSIGLVAFGAWVTFAAAELILVIDIVSLDRWSTLVVGLSLAVVGLPLYQWRPGAPTHLGIAVAGVVTIAGILVLLFDTEDVVGSAFGFDSDDAFFWVSGLLFVLFGLGWMHLADRRLLVPRNLGYLLGGWVALIGAQFFGAIAQGWLVVMLALGLFLGAAGINRSRTLLMAIGTVYVLYASVGLLELVFEDSALSAGIVMALAGAAALAAVIVRAGTAAAGPAAPPPQTPHGSQAP